MIELPNSRDSVPTFSARPSIRRNSCFDSKPSKVSGSGCFLVARTRKVHSLTCSAIRMGPLPTDRNGSRI